MIGSRRCRSISFCTKLVGTESRAKPSVITSGLTSLSQALCCGVRVDGAGAPLVASPAGVSPLSSAITVFHTATKGGSGSAVNDGYPLKLVQGTTKRTRTNCPHSYPQPVERQSSSLCCLPAGTPRGLGSAQRFRPLWARDLFGRPRFVVCSPSRCGNGIGRS